MNTKNKLRGHSSLHGENYRNIRKYIDIISKQIIFSISSYPISTKLCAIYSLLRIFKLVEM